MSSFYGSSTEEVDPEAAFHSAVREYVVCLLIFIALYGLSYAIVVRVKRRSESDDLYSGDDQDYVVYRISVWICTFSLAVSIGAVLLLPFSMMGNEIRRLYPHSYYILWLNSSLIQSLWTYIFLLSNLCLFVLIPFAYFFIESEGFSGLKKGIMTRVYEALAVCTLMIVLVFCLAHLISILLDDEDKGRYLALFKIWNYQLPFIYSCVSLFGVFMLLTCTPIGFARMFTVVGALIVKPKAKKDLEIELKVTTLEEETLERKIKGLKVDHLSNGRTSAFHQVPPKPTNGMPLCNGGATNVGGAGDANGFVLSPAPLEVVRRTLMALLPHADKLSEVSRVRRKLEEQRRRLRWIQNLKYPIAMILLLALTGISMLMVVSNTFQLLVGFRTLPSYRQIIELGNTSSSALGIVGATIEITIIIYIMLASLVGFYSIPGARRLRPRRQQTSMTTVIGNCCAVLVLSSALPVLARTLGITTFDLLGAFGKLDWLGNFYLVWSYNVLFAVATALCLATKFTATMRKELCKRFNEATCRLRTQPSSSELESSKDVTTQNGDLVNHTNPGDKKLQ